MSAAHCPESRVRRLLIADDRARTRRALRAVLALAAGIEQIGEAADGEETIAAVERLRPDIVILDIRMPRLDGIAATSQIKRRWPEIRVIAHSLAEELSEDALAAGADPSSRRVRRRTSYSARSPRSRQPLSLARAPHGAVPTRPQTATSRVTNFAVQRVTKQQTSQPESAHADRSGIESLSMRKLDPILDGLERLRDTA